MALESRPGGGGVLSLIILFFGGLVLDCASVDGSRDRALDFTRSGLLYTTGGGALNPGSDAASDAGTDADLALEEARDDGFDNAGGWGCAGGRGVE